MSTPAYYGRAAIARKVTSGRAVMLTVGDSINSGSANCMFDAKMRVFRPKKFAGMVIPGNVAGSAVSATYRGITTIMTATEKVAFDAAATGAGAYSAFWSQCYATFDGSTIPALVHPYDNNLVEGTLSFGGNYWSTGETFMDGKAITASAIIYNNANGCQNCQVFGFDSFATWEVADFSCRNVTPGWQKYSVQLAARTYSARGALQVGVRPKVATTPAATDKLISQFTMLDTGEDGLVLHLAAYGGSDTDFWLSQTRITDAHLSGTVAAVGTDIVELWLGNNDVGSKTKAQFKANILLLIARFRLANPAMLFLLVSTYDTNNALYSQYADALLEIAQADAGCLFLNVFQSAGSFAFLDTWFISTDHVHPNHPTGDYYFASVEWELLQRASIDGISDSQLVSMGFIL